ncbi:MAG: hypothetical protein JXQ29_15290 [Planctomycetes bacterium]|nr:hypothetical protein [Planctomycetota bacterium]
MLGFLRDLKDPWKLLVSALVVANLTAAVAVAMMIGNRKTAHAALNEAKLMLQTPTRASSARDGVVFSEFRELEKIRAITRGSELESTSESDVRKYIHKWANTANLPTQRQIQYKVNTLRRGIKEHIWTLSFTEKEPTITREQLAYFLFNIKVLTPQLKIQSIVSGPSTEDHEKADQWKPQVVFVLTKEEAEET